MGIKSDTVSTHYISTLFILNKSQAIRIPKKIAFPNDVETVRVVRLGNSIILTPTNESWNSWFEGPGVSEDYMTHREQPQDQEREDF